MPVYPPSGIRTQNHRIQAVEQSTGHTLHGRCDLLILPITNTGEGKVCPRRGHEDPEEEYNYTSTLSLTSALDGGKWLTPRPGRFTPRERDTVPTA